MWIEVFKTGTWTDASGKTRTWTTHDIDAIVQNYNPEFNEAPLVLGHPEDDSPAYGWVEAIKRVGDTMLVKTKQMVEKFTNWIKDGHYKKVSIAINGDMTLRHVGFLGGTPPAVKGLKAPEFAAVEFSQYDLEQIEFSNPLDTNNQEDNMKEIDALKAQLAEKEKEISEKETTISDLENKFQASDEEKETARQELTKQRLEMRKIEFEQFLNEEIVFESLTEEQRGTALKILNVLDSVKFSESEEDKETPVKKFQSFLKELPARVELSEVAKKEKAAEDEETTSASKFTNGDKKIVVNEESLALHKKVMDRAKDKNISFSEALHEIREEASNG